MWVVKLTLRRPDTFIVMALLTLLVGISAIKPTPTDILPFKSSSTKQPT
jgi:multidrug efflux pump subunit AcrB